MPETTPDTLDHLVHQRLLPQLRTLCERLLSEGRAMQLDGVAVFNGKDKFLPGKIAMGLSWLLLETPRDDPRFAAFTVGFQRMAQLTLDDTNDSWGIYYYIGALYRLARAELLHQVLDDSTLAHLQARLDWRGFVREHDFSLIDLPTNYYGVAFSIARLRHLLGWEDAHASEVLLEHTVKHYRAYSGEFGFSDETDGEGRFDRYSILLIGEICQRCIETGLPLSEELTGWLQRATGVILLRLNPHGDGFDFGRSIGPYGDTAFLEVLAAAASLKLLTPEQQALAHSFAICATRKFADFWIDPSTGSVNLWDKGRRTDAYRGKHRILGENISLIHQFLYTSQQWAALGAAHTPELPDFAERLARLPRFTTTWFARGEHDRALITFRDGQRVFSLPVISGGAGQHAHNPYFPIPFSNGLIQGAADAGWPQLLPRITLGDGSVLIPAAFQRELQCEDQGECCEVRYTQAALDRLGNLSPQADTRVSVATRYRLAHGVLSREDIFTAREPMENARLEIEFASFDAATQCAPDQIRFEGGAARLFHVEGLARCRIDDVSQNPLYRAPMGQLASCVRATTEGLCVEAGESFTIRWTLHYR